MANEPPRDSTPAPPSLSTDPTASSSAAPDSVAPDSTAPDSTAPASAADLKLQELMRRALGEDPVEPSVDVLNGVQQKLHERSGGKFYADGWSTARHPPFATYFITSLMMLAVIAIIYAILTPLVGDPIPVAPDPKPVQVLPGRSPGVAPR